MSDDLAGYTAFEPWRYANIIHKSEHRQRWRSLTDSFFYASEILVHQIAADRDGRDREGLAAIFLFRHYLELMLKSIILNGRWLERANKNAAKKPEPVKRIHQLSKLWEGVLQDARPKIPDDSWGRYDIAFIELCIAEFDAVDQRGFSFRYAGEEGDFCLFDYRTLARVMDHIRQILEGIDTCLAEGYAENKEYESYLLSELGPEY